jgi:predicted DNA-binding transcriptional regulator AlpA
MAVPNKTDSPMKAALSVSAMCRLLKMSRSQFYWHVKRGTFHAPLYLASNKRPYFTASMVEDNLRARQSGVTVSGEYVIFYDRLPSSTSGDGKKAKAEISSLLEGLKKLPLHEVTPEQVRQALAVCFPQGTTGHDETAVLTAVFRHLKRSESA